MASTVPFADRTQFMNNISSTRSELSQEIAKIGDELDAIVIQSQPLLKKQVSLQKQVATLDAFDEDIVSRNQTSKSALSHNDEASKHSPLRRPRSVADVSPSLRHSPSGSTFTANGRRLRHPQGVTRNLDLDLATELSEGLVEEVRKLQAQLFDKDELLKDVTKSRVMQERVSEELEARMQSMLVEEEKLKAINWDLELRAQQADERVSTIVDNHSRLEAEYSKATTLNSKNVDEIERLQEASQTANQHIAELKTSHVNAMVAQKEIHNDLRAEIALLMNRLETAKADLEEQRHKPYIRPDLGESSGGIQDMVEMEDPDTPPGSPPLSPIKGTPHRNVTLESETLKGTLFHNQTKMLRQRKELEREKAQRLSLQKHLRDAEDELEALRQTLGSQTSSKRKLTKPTERAKRTVRAHDIFNSGRLTHSETNMVEDDPFWESAIDTAGDSLPIEPRHGRAWTTTIESGQDTEHESEMEKHLGSPPHSEHSCEISGSDGQQTPSFIDRHSRRTSCSTLQRRPSFGERSASARTPVALDTELDGLLVASSPSVPVGPPSELTTRMIVTCDASTMTEPWYPAIENIKNTRSEPQDDTVGNILNTTFIQENPAAAQRHEADEKQFGEVNQLQFVYEDPRTYPATSVPILDSDVIEVQRGDYGTSLPGLEIPTVPCEHAIISGVNLQNSSVVGVESTVEGLNIKSAGGSIHQSLSEALVNLSHVPVSAGDTQSELQNDTIPPLPTEDTHTEMQDDVLSKQLDSSLQHCVQTTRSAENEVIEFEEDAQPEVLIIGTKSSTNATLINSRSASSLSQHLWQEQRSELLPDNQSCLNHDRPEMNDDEFPRPPSRHIQETDFLLSNAVQPAPGTLPTSPFASLSAPWLQDYSPDMQWMSSSVTHDSILPRSTQTMADSSSTDVREPALVQEESQQKSPVEELNKAPVLHAKTANEPRGSRQSTPELSDAPLHLSPSLSGHGDNITYRRKASLTNEITGTDSAIDSDSTMPTPERIRQLRTERYNYGSPTAKAEKVLGKSPQHDSLASSQSVPRSLRSRASIDVVQGLDDFGMAPPIKPSTARDTVRRKQKNIPRTSGVQELSDPLLRSAAATSTRTSAMMPARSYSQRSISSISSFASEIDEHVNIRHRAPENRPLAENPTDPATIESITRTMIGMSMYKYTRRPGRQGLSEKRHKRYFWIHPYTRTLYWSVYNPVNAPEGAIIKSAPILTLTIEDDFNTSPPGLHQRSLCIDTPRRTLKLTAMQSIDHEDWVRALNFLLFGSSSGVQTAEAALETDQIVRDFCPSLRGTSPQRSPVRRIVHSNQISHADPVVSSKIIGGSLSSRFGSYFSRSRSSRAQSFDAVAESRQRHSMNLRESPDFAEPLTLDSVANGPGLENVRSCCGGRHDVTDLCKRPNRSRSSSRVRA